jgi:hypothetical protein
MTEIILTRRVALNMGASAASVTALPMSLVIVTARPDTPPGFGDQKHGGSGRSRRDQSGGGCAQEEFI